MEITTTWKIENSEIDLWIDFIEKYKQLWFCKIIIQKSNELNIPKVIVNI